MDRGFNASGGLTTTATAHEGAEEHDSGTAGRVAPPSVVAVSNDFQNSHPSLGCSIAHMLQKHMSQASRRAGSQVLLERRSTLRMLEQVLPRLRAGALTEAVGGSMPLPQPVPCCTAARTT